MADKPQNAPAGGKSTSGVPGIDVETGHMDSRWDDPAGPAQEAEAPRTFTQADLDRQIGERLARERAKYADYDEVKRKALELEEIQLEQQSEFEKAVAKAVKEERANNLREYETERRSNRLQIAVANHARELADVDDVVLNLSQGDTNELFNNEGSVDDGAFGKALEDLLERKPHLRGGGQVPTGDADAGRGATPAHLPPEQQHNQDMLALMGLKPQ